MTENDISASSFKPRTAADKSTADTSTKRDPIFDMVAADLVKQAEAWLREVRAGRALYNYNKQPSTVVQSAHTARTRILATYDCRTEERRRIWGDTTHADYLQEQAERIKQGVKVRRVLILPARGDLHRSVANQLARVVQEQLSVGVELRAIFFDDLGRWDEDVVVVDSQRIHRYKLDDNPGFSEIVLAIDQESIVAGERLFAELWEKARPWDELMKSCSETQGRRSLLEVIDHYTVKGHAPDMDALREQIADDIAEDQGVIGRTTDRP